MAALRPAGRSSVVGNDFLSSGMGPMRGGTNKGRGGESSRVGFLRSRGARGGVGGHGRTATGLHGFPARPQNLQAKGQSVMAYAPFWEGRAVTVSLDATCSRGCQEGAAVYSVPLLFIKA